MAYDILAMIVEAVAYAKRWALLATFIVYVFKEYLDPKGMPNTVYEMALLPMRCIEACIILKFNWRGILHHPVCRNISIGFQTLGN